MNEKLNIDNVKINILIVDDQKLYIEYLNTLISKYITNVNIFTATSGKDALSILENKHIDIVLLDVVMPDITGWDIARYIKDNLDDKNIALIFITANCIGDEFIKQGFELGAVDYIEKPIDKNQLINRLKLYINNFLSEKKIVEEISKNKEKDKLLLQKEIMIAQSNILERIAHHWRQPLSIISSNAGVIKLSIEFGLDTHEGTLQNIEYIEKASQELSKTIDQFKNFFEPESVKEIFDMGESINETIDIIIVSLKEQNINIDFQYKDIKLEGYKNEFKQAILNILTNAKDAIRSEKIKNQKLKGEIDITVLKKNQKTLIHIFNNGGNSSLEILERMFEPYFTTKFEDKGTGIGLYMTKTIIETSMNGTITAHNIKEGMQFNITI